MISETIVPKVKIDWLGNKVWSFEIKVLEFHQKAEHPLVTTINTLNFKGAASDSDEKS